jgi:hypothetical protein
MTGTAPSNASSAALHGENESRSEPSGECARCQAGYVNDKAAADGSDFLPLSVVVDLAGDGAGLKNALSGGNLGVTEASIWRISAYTDRCKDRR